MLMPMDQAEMIRHINESIRHLEAMKVAVLAQMQDSVVLPQGAMIPRSKALKVLGVNQAGLEQLIVFGHLPPANGSRYPSDAVLACKAYIEQHPEVLRAPNDGRKWDVEDMWNVLTEPVSPNDLAQLKALCERYGRTVGAIQSLKVCAQNVEAGDDRFNSPGITDAILQIRDIQANNQRPPLAWKRRCAARYNPATCARPWAVSA